MKKLIVSLIFLTIACSSNTMRSSSPIIYNTITTGIYTLDEESPGEYHKVIFKTDGTIEGAVYLKLQEDIKWKGDNAHSRFINLYSSDYANLKGYIYFPINKYHNNNNGYNGNYLPFLENLNLLVITNASSRESRPLVYITDSTMINNIANALNEIKKVKDDINKILSSVDSSNLFILDFSSEKNFEKMNSISQYKDLSFYDLFDEAYFNDKENSNIFNSTKLDNDEFIYREKKPVYEKVRNKKFLFIHSDSTDELLELEFSEYDFDKKGYFCTIKKITPIGGLMGSGAFKIIEMVSKPFFVSMNENDAKEFKNHKLKLSVLAERSTQIKAIKVTRIKINELGIKDVAIDEKIWRQYQQQYRQHASKCYIANEKIKQLNLNVMKYHIIDTDTNKIYTNIH